MTVVISRCPVVGVEGSALLSLGCSLMVSAIVAIVAQNKPVIFYLKRRMPQHILKEKFYCGHKSSSIFMSV